MFGGSRVGIPVGEYYLRTQDPVWQDFVRLLSLAKAVSMRKCKQLFSRWTDSNGHTFYRGTLCQMRDVCPTCSWVYNEESVASSLELYRLLCNSVGAKIVFGEGTFTIPPSGQTLVEDGELGVLRRAAFETVNEILSEDGRLVLGAVGSTHHWHSSKPLRSWFPHAEITVLGLAYEKDKDRFVPLDLYLEGEKLRRFDSTWRMKFMESFGNVRTPRFSAKWHLGNGYATAEHRFGYQFRRPVQETFDAVAKLRSLNSVNVEWAKRLLIRPKNEKRHQWYGYLSDGLRSRYLQKLGITIERKSLRDKARRKALCPDCWDELVCVGHGTSLEELRNEPGAKLLLFKGPRRQGP